MIKILSFSDPTGYSAYPDKVLHVEWNPSKNVTQNDHFRVAVTDDHHIHLELDRKQQEHISVGNSKDYHISCHLQLTDSGWQITDNRAYITRRGYYSVYDNIPATHRAKLESLFVEIATEVHKQQPNLFKSAEWRKRQETVQKAQRTVEELQSALEVAKQTLQNAEQALEELSS